MTANHPNAFTEELAEKICTRLSGGESLRSICGAKNNMPSVTSVMRWLAANQKFREQYALAREAQAEYLVDEIVEIADDATNDYMEKRNADGVLIGWAENGENVQRSRLRVDARKWAASKLAPKKYGDKQVHEHGGPDGGPITLEALIIASLKKD
jgi:hypothetical protein